VDNKLVSLVVIEKMTNMDTLLNCGAVAILKSLEMDIDRASIETLIDGGDANVLRKFYENGVDVFAEQDLFAIVTSPNVLQFVLLARPDLVNGQKFVSNALASDQLDILQVFYQHHGKVFLSQKLLNAAARKGALKTLKWAHNINSDIKPTRECLPSILVDGHADVLEFLQSQDKNFFPGPYQASAASKDTMWHFNIIVKLFRIDPNLIPLGKIYRHALELQNLDTVAWARSVIQESNCKEFQPTLEGVRHSIDANNGLFVLWIVEKDPTVFVDRDLIGAILKRNIWFRDLRWTKEDLLLSLEELSKASDKDQRWTEKALLTSLKDLYKASGKDKRYLPTVDELRNRSLDGV
jgi:hypothetical protein